MASTMTYGCSSLMGAMTHQHIEPELAKVQPAASALVDRCSVGDCLNNIPSRSENRSADFIVYLEPAPNSEFARALNHARELLGATFGFDQSHLYPLHCSATSFFKVTAHGDQTEEELLTPSPHSITFNPSSPHAITPNPPAAACLLEGDGWAMRRVCEALAQSFVSHFRMRGAASSLSSPLALSSAFDEPNLNDQLAALTRPVTLPLARLLMKAGGEGKGLSFFRGGKRPALSEASTRASTMAGRSVAESLVVPSPFVRFRLLRDSSLRPAGSNLEPGQWRVSPMAARDGQTEELVDGCALPPRTVSADSPQFVRQMFRVSGTKRAQFPSQDLRGRLTEELAEEDEPPAQKDTHTHTLGEDAHTHTLSEQERSGKDRKEETKGAPPSEEQPSFLFEVKSGIKSAHQPTHTPAGGETAHTHAAPGPSALEHVIIAPNGAVIYPVAAPWLGLRGPGGQEADASSFCIGSLCTEMQLALHSAFGRETASSDFLSADEKRACASAAVRVSTLAVHSSRRPEERGIAVKPGTHLKLFQHELSQQQQLVQRAAALLDQAASCGGCGLAWDVVLYRVTKWGALGAEPFPCGGGLDPSPRLQGMGTRSVSVEPHELVEVARAAGVGRLVTEERTR